MGDVVMGEILRRQVRRERIYLRPIYMILTSIMYQRDDRSMLSC